MTEATTDYAPPHRWLWAARVVLIFWSAVEFRQLLQLIGWERTLPYARDFLPAAIAMQTLQLAALVGILLLLVVGRQKRWGLALGLAWGAMAAGAWLWPHFSNGLHWLVWRLGGSPVLIHRTLSGATLSRIRFRALSGVLLALCCGRAFVLQPRGRLDPAILAVSVFYVSLYTVGIGIVGRLLIKR